MRIVSWNVNHWQRRSTNRWDDVEGALRDMGACVALLQEVQLEPNERTLYAAIDEADQHLRWGTAIVALSDDVTLRQWHAAPIGRATAGLIELSHPGTTLVADLVVKNDVVCTAVCLYGQQIPVGNGKKYASTTVHRQISDLAPLLDTSRNKKARVLVAGDLNVSTQWDKNNIDVAMDRTVFDRFRAHDFRDLIADSVQDGHEPDCFCSEKGRCRHVRTLRHRNSLGSRPWQTDYAFASPTLQVASTTVLDDERWWSLSDHAPVAVDVTVG